MEVISCHAAMFRGLKDISWHRSRPPILHGKRLYYLFVESGSTDSRYSHGSKLTRCDKQQSSRTSCSHEHIDSSITSETYNAYVLNGEEGVTGMTPKVSIPSLPDKDNGDDVAPISSHFWEWKPKLTVHYEASGSENEGSPAVLFLPGFGVGSFHYEKQLKDLGRDYRTWALDFLGQGMSLPCEDPTFQSRGGNKRMSDGASNVWGFGDESETWAKELVFSIDLWRDQVRYFIEEVIKEPVYVVGNSLGGFVALYFAASNPELVKGVTLLNATPFWGFLPNPERSPRLSRLFPWAGTFPFPSSVRMFIEVLWLKISDPKSITEILKQVYADHSTKVDKVFSRIIETTQHPAAAASFASIIFAPQGQLSFEESLTRCRMNNTPICLMYGREDPWVRPIWGLQVKRQVPDAPYYEISPAGHCPHDEVPEVINFLLRGWIQNLESNGSITLPLLEVPESVDYDIARDLEFLCNGSRKLVRVQFHGSKISIWNWLSSNFKPIFKRKDSLRERRRQQREMGKRAKSSRKGKKEWRANISTEDFEDYFEKSTKDALSGGSLADVPSDSLFFVDKSRDLSVKRKIEKKRDKVLRTDSLLQRNPFIKPIPSSIQNKKTSKKNRKAVQASKDKDAESDSLKDETGHDTSMVDLWQKGHRAKCKKKPPKTSVIPAVEVEPAGCSFNPEPESHEDALARAVGDEMQKIYKHELGPEPVPLTVEGELVDEDYKDFLDVEPDNDDEDEDQNENENMIEDGDADLEKRPLKLKRVTRVELNKRARRKEKLKVEAEAKKVGDLSKEIDSIPDILQEIAKEDEEKLRRNIRRVVSKEERRKELPPRLGKYKFEPASLQVLLSEEKTGSLRQLKGCCTLVKDRFKSLEKRGLIIPSKKSGRK